jgi:uncharacterized protein (UPF0335 family)
MSGRMSDERAEKLGLYVDRILALHAKADAKQLEVRAVYAQLSKAGFDKTSVGKIVAYLRLPASERARIDAEQHVSVAMPLREWGADLASAPALKDAIASLRD